MATKTLLSIEQFDQLPERTGILYELNQGEVVIMTEPMPRHNRVRDNIAVAIRQFALPLGLGEVFIETGYQLTRETVRIPDASFLPTDRALAVDPDQRIQGAPALAIEVVSPTDLAEELTVKVKQYLAAGALSVWVVYPKTGEVHVYHADGGYYIRRENETLEDAAVLPGFSLELKTILGS